MAGTCSPSPPPSLKLPPSPMRYGGRDGGQAGPLPKGSAVAEAVADREGELSPGAESADVSSGRMVRGSWEERPENFRAACGRGLAPKPTVCCLRQSSRWTSDVIERRHSSRESNPDRPDLHPGRYALLVWWRINDQLRPIEIGQEAGGCTRTVSFTGRDAAITPRS